MIYFSPLNQSDYNSGGFIFESLIPYYLDFFQGDEISVQCRVSDLSKNLAKIMSIFISRKFPLLNRNVNSLKLIKKNFT